MKEIKILNAEDIIRAAAEHSENTTVIDFYGIEIEVTKMIPLAAEVALINNVVKASFSQETGEYLPESRMLATRAAVLSIYSDIELPQDQEEMAILAYRTGVFEAVESVIAGEPQYIDILNSIAEICSVIINSNRRAFEHSLNDALTQFSGLADSIAGLFDGVEVNDLNRLLAAVGDGGIDEEKIVSAVVREQNLLREGAEKKGEVVPFPAGDGDSNNDAGDDGE